MPKQMPKQTPEQSGAPADDACADDTIVVSLTAEEIVILTSSDEEPAAEQEENQPPGPTEVFSIGLNEQQTPVSCCRVIVPFTPTANAESWAVEAFSLCVFTSNQISEWSPMERRAPAQSSS